LITISKVSNECPKLGYIPPPSTNGPRVLNPLS